MIKQAYTISYHYYKQSSTENHLDLFLDIGGSELLVHYFCSINDYRVRKLFKLGRFHRRRYLLYSGYLSNNRGKVRVIKQGFFKPAQWFIKQQYKKTIAIDIDEYLIIS